MIHFNINNIYKYFLDNDFEFILNNFLYFHVLLIFCINNYYIKFKLINFNCLMCLLLKILINFIYKL